MGRPVLYTLFLFSIISIVFSSCKGDVVRSLSTKPKAMGRINQVVILSDQSMSEGAMGDSISYYFESAYPIMPAEEPLFDIRLMTIQELFAKPYSKELRTYVLLADVSDTSSLATRMLKEDLGTEKFSRAQKDPSFNSSVGQDKWAKGQIIIYIFGNGRENIAKSIRENFANISKRINVHDNANLAATVFGIQDINLELSKQVLDSFGLTIKIPGLYKKALQNENFLWIRMDHKDINQSLVFRRFPYTSKEQFKMDNIIKMRNTYGKLFIQTGFKDAYMSTNVIDLPTYEYSYMHNNIYYKEVRGIWETVNDFMGGPFVSYILLNEPAGEIVFIDAFVFAPGKQKRDYVQQLDCIVKSSTFPGVTKKKS